MKALEAEVYCPTCRNVYGRIFRVEIGEGQYEHTTEPSPLPKFCSICEVPLERKA